MNKEQLKMNHFYKAKRYNNSYIYVFVWFKPEKGGWDWVGKYDDDDSVGFMNKFYYSGEENDELEYEEVDMSNPIFLSIGQFVIKEIFDEQI